METSRIHGRGARRRFVLLPAGLLLALIGFVALASGLSDVEAYSFDTPTLWLVHASSRPWLDQVFWWIAAFGYAFGVLPFDVLLVGVLAARRRWYEMAFALLALGSSLALNTFLRQFFARPRPALWDSGTFRDGFGFPSGHAMATMTLTCVLVLLAWRTRWRWHVLVGMSAFTLLVGMSRLYLGVHYPSDVLAGWAAGCVVAVASFLVVFGRRRHPWDFGPTRL